jgi:hypothetical protein
LVIEEADESAFWLELLVEAEVVTPSRVERLLGQSEELVRIFVASRETARRNARVRARTRTH